VTTLAHPVPSGKRGGGLAARRALVRWAGRLLRREWRQQLLVLTLLTVSVAAAIGSITTAYNAVPADDGEFGSADYLLNFDGSDPRKLAAGLESARTSFGTIDEIDHRSVRVPGAVDAIDYRAQDPEGAYGGELLALLRGSFPVGDGQVAVTDGVAESLRLEVGSTLSLDGRRRRVVGIVENPQKLSDEFALVAASSSRPDRVSVLVDADARSLDSFYRTLDGGDRSQSAFAGSMEQGSDVSGATETLAMFSVATVFLLLASLVAAAGFAVVAQRRLRQLGMLAAVGATEKQIRLVLVWNGALVGAIAAGIGAVIGLLLWEALAPTLESAVDHRIDPLNLPWGLVVAAVLLAILGATAAAWWPGRTVARVPVVLALSARAPDPRPVRHSAVAATGLIAIGIGCLALSDRDKPHFIVAGLVSTILGTLLLGPSAIRVFSGVAGHVPIGPRLALRDLARYQARSGAALAAITLALGIAAAVVITGAAEEKRENERAAAQLPNLSDRQIRVYTGATRDTELIALPVETPAERARSAAQVRRLAMGLGQATVVPLRKAVQPGDPPIVTFEGDRALVAVGLTRRVDRETWNRASGVYVATPALLAYLGIDPATVAPGTDFLADPAVPTDQLVLLDMRSRKQLRVTNVQRIESERILGSGRGDTGRIPDSFVTVNGVRRHGWKQLPAGWLVESSRPLTNDQIVAARQLASQAGLEIETQRERASLTKPMAIATAAGALLALAILALTVGLIRSESAGDLRTLTATGATGTIRRTLTAATAGALALLGAVLGIGGAYVVLAATYFDDLGYLTNPPVLNLLVLVIGVPLIAVAAGWLLAGREPSAIGRSVIE
jgi:putative ABC transport system permease protein